MEDVTDTHRSTSRTPHRTSSTAVGSSSPRTRASASAATAAPYPARRPGPSDSASTSTFVARPRPRARTRTVPNDDDDPLGGFGRADDVMDVDPVGPRGALPTLAPALASASAFDTSVPERQENDVQRLARAWQDERHAPDILPAQDALLGRVLDAIRRQTSDANALRAADALSEEDHYMTMLVQTEVERVKFVVRSYVRTRLFKIEKYAAYITSTPDVQTRLTEAELRHAQRYATLLVSQFRTTVLGHLPETQQGLDDDVLTMPSMITEPSKDKPVFFHALTALDHLALADGSTLDIPRGSIYLMPYRVVEQHLLRGEVELV
ncbi:hypothetical protein M0805_002975 [Coniferiporia weirii]|nr:hypothetical protein M0805_002975 [Coniferiporia weirii]